MNWNNDQYLRDFGEKTTFYFENEIQKELWNEELSGQISDGMWENTNGTGWIFWCHVKSEIGPSTTIKGLKVYSGVKYNFGFSRLIQYVGDRMIEIGQKYDPQYDERKLRQDLKTISYAMKQFGGVA